jgi:hypothetical protein
MKKLLIISLLLIGCGSEKEHIFVCDCKQKEKVEIFVSSQIKEYNEEFISLSGINVAYLYLVAYNRFCTKVDSTYTPPQDTTKSSIGLDYCLSFKIKVKI